MAPRADFDVAAAHRYFAAACFNATWDLIEKEDRTPADDQRMISLALASMYHWSERPDCGATERSGGYWQVSRVHALVGLAGEARRYGEICREVSGDLAPFYRGYAHEALARAARLAGDTAAAAEHLAKARALASEITDDGERELLVADLATLG